MKGLTVSVAFVAMVGLSGCSNMSSTEQRALSGAAIGAAGGTAIGAMTGSAGTGAAIGAAAGGLGGYMYDRHRKSQGEPDY